MSTHKAYLPLGTDVYDLNVLESDSHIAHAAALAAGYLMSSNKIVWKPKRQSYWEVLALHFTWSGTVAKKWQRPKAESLKRAMLQDFLLRDLLQYWQLQD